MGKTQFMLFQIRNWYFLLKTLLNTSSKMFVFSNEVRENFFLINEFWNPNWKRPYNALKIKFKLSQLSANTSSWNIQDTIKLESWKENIL